MMWASSHSRYLRTLTPSLPSTVECTELASHDLCQSSGPSNTKSESVSCQTSGSLLQSAAQATYGSPARTAPRGTV